MYYIIRGWVDHFKTWQKDLQKKFDTGQNIKVDLLVGADYIQKLVEQALNTKVLSKDMERLREFLALLRGEKDIIHILPCPQSGTLRINEQIFRSNVSDHV